jgi:hypothetical protein
MYLAMKQAGYTVEEIVRAVATVSNGATALLPVLERVLLWLLQHPDTVAGALLGERTWPQVIREAMVQGALFPVTPPLIAGQGARIGDRPVPEGTVVLPSLASAVHHPRGGAWLTFGPGQHRCPGDELTFAAVEEYAGAFFRRYPRACLTTSVLAWRDGPLATPRAARFAVCRLRRTGDVAALPGASPLRPGPRRSARLARRRAACRRRAATSSPAVMFGMCRRQAMIWCGISAGPIGRRAGGSRLPPRVAAGLRLPVAAVR